MTKYNFDGKLLENNQRVITAVRPDIIINKINSSANPSGQLSLIEEDGLQKIGMTLNLPQGAKGDPPRIGNATATTLPAGSSPTVNITETSTGSGVYNIAFGIPQGLAGNMPTFNAVNFTQLDVGEEPYFRIVQMSSNENVPVYNLEVGLPKGERGPKPNITLGEVTFVDNNVPGDVWDSSDPNDSNIILNFKIPKGPQGAQGERGQSGEALPGIETVGQRSVITDITQNPNNHYLTLHKDAGISATDIASGVLPISRGGTGIATDANALINLASNTSANIFQENPRPGVTGILSIGNGGSGLSTAPSMLVNLSSSSASSIFQATPRPGVTGTLPLANGGTGTAAQNSQQLLEAWGVLGQNGFIQQSINDAIVISSIEPQSIYTKIWIKI